MVFGIFFCYLALCLENIDFAKVSSDRVIPVGATLHRRTSPVADPSSGIEFLEILRG